MARKDQLTGKAPMSGNHVSHSNNKVRRRFNVNLQKKRFFIPEENRWITLRVSTRTLKTINKNGISAVLAEARIAALMALSDAGRSETEEGEAVEDAIVRQISLLWRTRPLRRERLFVTDEVEIALSYLGDIFLPLLPALYAR